MRKDILLFGVVAAAAVAAATLALKFSSGTVDATAPPAPSPPASAKAPRLDIPGLVLPPGFPAPAAKILLDAWSKARFGTAEEAAAVFAEKVTPRAKGSPFDDCAPAALEAMGPTLELLIQSEDGRLAATAMRSTTALARLGGAAGREALARTGLVEKAFALQAATGPADLRVETARNLGVVGGKAAVEWLVLLLRKAPEPAVRVAAVEALSTVPMADGGLPPNAVVAIRSVLEDPATPPPLRQSCIRTADRAWPSFKGYEVGPLVAACLASPDAAVRAAAVGFFVNHPLPLAGEALLKTLADADPRIVEGVADALGEVRPPGAREALEKRRAGLEDPAALKAVDRALARLPR